MRSDLQAVARTVPMDMPLCRVPAMRVSLAFVAHRVDVWLRFGRPVHETVLDQWRRVAVFEPGAVCCRVRWMADDQGTASWQLTVLQAPVTSERAQRIAGVVPSAHILLCADGEPAFRAVCAAIDSIEDAGIDPCAVDMTYWRTVGNLLATHQPLLAYTGERQIAYFTSEVPQ